MASYQNLVEISSAAFRSLTTFNLGRIAYGTSGGIGPPISGKFEKATKDQELSPPVSQFVAAAAQRVKAGDDRIRDLKHALHGKV